MYLALIVLPLLGSIFSGFFGRKVGVSGSQLITCTTIVLTTFLAILVFIEVGLNNIPVKIYLFRWIDSELLNVSWSFNFDSLTVSMLIPVLIVSSLVHIYSIGYMSHDPHNQRFFSYLSLFTFMMIILVTGDNYLVMFVGWEGVGVCSYLLVSFWFTRIAANQSSLAAFLTNRVGDCVLTIGMFAILWSFGNIDYYTIFSLTPYYSESIVLFVGICLLIGAMAKSSQVGLHVWLPMAMEGPTPVSALIHAATMVTAGVYLLMRSSPLIEYSSTVLICCLWTGAITTVFSSLIGLFQQDIKKVIAYSTMSQLGIMVIAIGLSSYNIALFHLINHAFYKALLFLGAGAVIHAVADNQDFRKYGGLISYLPLSYSVMMIASLSLVAFPFMTGFYSKDFILESAYGQYQLSGIIVYFIASIGAMFTTLYSVKVLYLTFLANPNGPLTNYKHYSVGNNNTAHEGDIFMSTPLIILALFSIFYGYITKDIYIGIGSSFFSDNSIYIHPNNEILLDTEFAVPTLFKLLPLFFTIALTIISILFTEFFPKLLINFKLSTLGYNIFSFFNQRFLIEMFYNKYITGLLLKLGGQTTKIMDKGVVETFGPYGLEKKLTDISKSINSLSTGIVTSYALYILIGLIFYISIVYLSVTNMDYILLVIILYSLIDITFKENDYANIKQSNILEPLLAVFKKIIYSKLSIIIIYITFLILFYYIFPILLMHITWSILFLKSFGKSCCFFFSFLFFKARWTLKLISSSDKLNENDLTAYASTSTYKVIISSYIFIDENLTFHLMPSSNTTNVNTPNSINPNSTGYDTPTNSNTNVTPINNNHNFSHANTGDNVRNMNNSGNIFTSNFGNGFSNIPQDRLVYYNNIPSETGLSNIPDNAYSNNSNIMYSNNPSYMYNNNTGNINNPGVMYSNNPPTMYHNNSPTMYHDNSPIMYHNNSPIMYHNNPPIMYNSNYGNVMDQNIINNSNYIDDNNQNTGINNNAYINNYNQNIDTNVNNNNYLNNDNQNMGINNDYYANNIQTEYFDPNTPLNPMNHRFHTTTRSDYGNINNYITAVQQTEAEIIHYYNTRNRKSLRDMLRYSASNVWNMTGNNVKRELQIGTVAILRAFDFQDSIETVQIHAVEPEHVRHQGFSLKNPLTKHGTGVTTGNLFKKLDNRILIRSFIDKEISILSSPPRI